MAITRRLIVNWFMILIANCGMIFGEGQIELVKMVKMGSTCVNHGYRTLITRSVIYCCAVCQTDGRCRSVSYSGQSDTCQLNDKSPDAHQNGSVVDTHAWDSFTAAKCSSPWLQYGGHCYLVVTDRREWLDAESWCQSYNSHLVDFQDAEEVDFIVSSVLSQTDTTGIFIGLYRDPALEIRYISGEPVTYTNYATGEPSSVNSNNEPTDCFVTNGAQTFNDIKCSYARPSVCKI